MPPFQSLALTIYAASAVVTGDVGIGATRQFYWSGRSVIESPSDGAVAVKNAAGTAYASIRGALWNEDGGNKPTCDASARGRIWHDYGAASVKDTVEVCAKDAADAYAWRVIY